MSDHDARHCALGSRPVLALSFLFAAAALTGCRSEDDSRTHASSRKPKARKRRKPKKKKPTTPSPVREPIAAGPYPSLLLSQAWFYDGDDGRPQPGPARLQIWRQGPEGWTASKLEDPQSNVFHKAVLEPGGTIVTIGAEQAAMKRWTYADGTWSERTLWAKPEGWGGTFDRLRDLEIGDVDGDGKDEYVIATHDGGVVAVYDPAEADKPSQVLELDARPDTFIHEIEIGDIDGDGTLEFFATPSDRNEANASQAGEVVQYHYQSGAYVRTVLERGEHTHAKEILAADIDTDGTSEFFAVFEARTNDAKEVTHPVEIRRYTPKTDGTWTRTTIATLDDRQTRFLVPGDFDGDGLQELVAAAFKTGLYFIDVRKDDAGALIWSKPQRFDAESSGFEHATYAADLDGDGTLELYVAADNQRELKRYDYDPDAKAFRKTHIGTLDDRTITWNIAAGVF